MNDTIPLLPAVDLYRPPLAAVIVGGVLVVLVGLATWGYLRGNRISLRNLALWGLRMVALAALGWMLAGPSVLDRSANTRKLRPRITILVDTSASMAQRDVALPERKQTGAKANSDSPISRYEALGQTWLADQTLARLRQVADINVVGFSGTGPAGPTADEADRSGSRALQRLGPPDGEQTRLIEAVHKAQKAKKTQVTQEREEGANSGNGTLGGGLVVLSDGHDTQRGVDASLRQRLGERGEPIFVVPVGQVDSTPDLAVQAWVDSDFVFSQQRTTIHAQVHRRGFANKSVQVELRREGQVIETRTLSVEDPSTKVSFEIKPESAPAQPVTLADYSVHAHLADSRQAAEESYTANNVRHVFVQVSAQRIQVLLLEAHPYWDTQRLARVLSDDPRIELTAVYQLNANRIVTVRDESPKSRSANQPPPTPDDASAKFPGPEQVKADWFDQFDVIVLGKGIEQFLPASKAQLLVNFVTRQGGGLVLARGRPAAPQPPKAADTLAQLDPLLPVEWGRQTVRNLRMELAEEGQGDLLLGVQRSRHEGAKPRRHEGGDPAGAEAREVRKGGRLSVEVSELPGMVAATRIVRRRAGSLVFLRQRPSKENPEAAPKPKAMAAVVSMRAGRGQVLAVLTDGLWRWDLLAGQLAKYDSVYHLFWSRAIQWLATGGRFLPGQDVSLTLDRLTVEPGESITARIATRYVDPADFSPMLTWIGPEGKRQTLRPMPTSASSQQTWRATIQPQTPGVHQIQLLTPGRPDLIDPQTPVQSRFAVQDRSIEKLDTSARPDLLKAIARASGGQSLGLSQRGPLLHRIHEIKTARQTDPHPDYTFAHLPILAIILSTLSLEWFIRRRTGLP